MWQVSIALDRVAYIQIGPGNHVIDTSHPAFQLNASVVASEVWLIGAGQNQTTLSPTDSSANSILDISGGIVRIRDLTARGFTTLRGGTLDAIDCTFNAAVFVYGGVLNVERGHFDNSLTSTTLGLFGAMRVTDGSATIRTSAFVNNTRANAGGALNVQGGSVMVFNSDFTGNRGDNGGAISSSGGTLRLSSCSIMYNEATGSPGQGGGLLVMAGGDAVCIRCQINENSALFLGGGVSVLEGGTFSMTAETTLHDNVRLVTDSTTGTVTRNPSQMRNRGINSAYALPAPAGTWISGGFDCEHYPLLSSSNQPCDLSRTELVNRKIALLPIGHLPQNFPYNCSPGVYGAVNSGSSDDDQSGPSCTAPCPAGFKCASGTVIPVACGPGTHCVEGSPVETPCASGSYSNATRRSSQAQCNVCPPGSSCSVGVIEPTACAPGTYAAEAGKAVCDLCPAGTFQPLANSTSCLPCEPGSYCA